MTRGRLEHNVAIFDEEDLEPRCPLASNGSLDLKRCGLLRYAYSAADEITSWGSKLEFWERHARDAEYDILAWSITPSFGRLANSSQRGTGQGRQWLKWVG
jgi:hypothetical protein